MLNPGRFAVSVGGGQYYDSLRHTLCAEGELGSFHMLSGQEEQAIHSRLFCEGPFQLLLIPSFECNLRCPQCYVGHLLKKPTGDRVGGTDPDRLISFIRRAEKYFGQLRCMTLVGGEPFLHADAFRHYLDADITVAATTNGVFDFDEVKDIIGRLDHLTFSIDGWPEQHNCTRKPLDSEIDPFTTTYRNLCRTTAEFPDLTVSVQGSVIDDEAIHPKGYLRYYALMLGAGVKREFISLGHCAPTVIRGPMESFLKAVGDSTRNSPCCDYSLHKGLVVYGNSVYGSYHQFAGSSPLASLDDPLDELLQRRKETVLESMPILHDDICMKECAAVGVCWGLCSSDRHVFGERGPSSVCNRVSKEERVRQMAQEKTRSEVTHVEGERPLCSHGDWAE